MGLGHLSHTAKMLFSFKIVSSTATCKHVNIDQKNASSDDQKSVYENRKFHEPQVRVVLLGEVILVL